ncbi:MAG: hypothetical protein FJ144_15460 [Deltaproteobacteria bacterium]|nr:hypothetical protein [Deltaproteobacteria bacterium]
MVGSGRRGRSALALVTAVVLAACGGGGGQFNALPQPAPPAQTTVSGLSGPEGLCFDSNGNLYIGSITGEITRVFPDGSREIFADLNRELAGLTTGPQNEIFAASPRTGEVLAVSQDGVVRVATSALDTPRAIVFDTMQRAIVSAYGLGGDPQIAVIEFNGTYHTLTTEIHSPNGMAFGPNHLLFVADTEMNRVVSMALDSAGNVEEPTVYASGIGRPNGIAFDQKGNLYVASGGQVWVVQPNNATLIPFVESGDLDEPANLAFGFGTGRDTGILYFTNFGFPLGTGTTVARTTAGIPGYQLFAP